MTIIQIFSLAWLAFVFTLSLWQHANLGLVMIPASFVLAVVAGVPMKQLYMSFPIQLMLLVLGVMYLWNHVQESGLADIFVKKTVLLARGRVYLLPWAMFGLAALVCALGALPAASLAVTMPVALEIAKQERIRSSLMGIIAIQGGCVGGFSPFNPWSHLISAQFSSNNIQFLSGSFFFLQGLLGLAIAVIAFFCFGGFELIRRPISRPESTEQNPSEKTTAKLTAYQLASMAGLLLFICLVLLKYDIGLTAFATGLVLQLLFRKDSKKAIAKLPWGIVILVAGVLLYVSLLDNLGVMREIGVIMGGAEQPSLVRFGVSFLGTIIANFESSSIAVLGLVVPIAIKSMGSAISAFTANLQIAVLSASIVVMASSPFHIGGALILAEADNYDRTYKDLLIWVVALAAALPFLAFLI